MRGWQTVPNPDWAGVKPQRLSGSVCHDRSHFVTVQCGCGEQMHVHESSIQQVADWQGVATACKGCGDVLIFEAGELPGMFAELRQQGWIT